jgi:acyl-CoA synthetase (AMP-forming)/AMP-acid ligase II
MIISGGENVYPAEVEKVRAAYPSIADATVIGVPRKMGRNSQGSCRAHPLVRPFLGVGVIGGFTTFST